LGLAVTLSAAGLVAVGAGSAAAAASPPTLDLKVLLIGGAGGGASDPTTAAWAAGLTNQGVPYTEVDAAGSYGAETVTLPTLPTSTASPGPFNGVVIADSPAAFAAGQLTALDTYEATFGVRQIDGYTAPYLGETLVSGGALDGTTGTLTAAGLAAFPALAGTIPFDTGTYGYSATVNAGAPYTSILNNSAGDTLAGVYQHPSTDPQAGVAELELNFDYNATQLQWLLLGPGLINWVTQDAHLGMDRNYVAMDIDDTFTPDNSWSIAVHDNDYSDADSLRMDPADVITAADWSNPTQEAAPNARPAGEPTTPFRLDQLFNYGGTVEYQNNELDLPGETEGPDPLLAQFQATDPNTGKPYSDDFGWISHTYDTPYLDVGCATQDYIEAELNQNTSDVTAAPGAALPGADESSAAGTGGLGLTESTVPAGSIDVSNPYGTYNPDVFVPGNHSGFADLEPGTPATVDPPDLDSADASTTGGTLAAGTYEYAVTDQFNGSDSTSTDQSQAYVTDGQQGDLEPVTVTGSTGSVSLTWQAICHAANYIIYRAAAPYTSWTEIGTYATPDSATLPDNSSGDTSPANTATVCVGPAGSPTSCAGEQELTFTDTGSDTSTPPAGVTYLNTPMPAGWTPPVVEDANELPWEQNPYFSAALTAAGITTVGADASKAYPDPPDDQFGIGTTYSGPTYAAGQPFVDGTAQVAPRHPINIFYNVATNAQELDEYNTLYTSVAPDSQCQNTAVTTCSSTLYTFPEVINQVVSGMFQNMLSNNPEINYVHQTNLMGTPPYSSILPPANYVPAATAASGTDGDGTLYEVLNPLIAEYDGYFNTNTPYVQLTMGGIGNTLADQTAWSGIVGAASPTVTASETNGVVTIDNAGTGAANVPVTVPPGTTVSGSSTTLDSYGGELSNWLNVAGSSSATLTENVAPAITSAASATSIVGAAFSFTVDTTGAPAPALTESGTLPSGITFTDNGNGTATIAGTSTTGTGGSYPITITATNANGTTTQSFTLTNAEAPAITSASTATFSTGVAGTYTVTTTGYPAPTVTETGALPSGLSFNAATSTTSATISGTPASGTAGTYPVTLSATNASGSTATLALTITVNTAGAPTITSGSTADFTLNTAGAVAITTTGSPTPAITETGTLPAGLSFTDNGNGTALLSGTPTATGTTDIMITANNGISPNATQSFTIVVGQAPAFTSADSTTFTAGTEGSFTVTTSGYPAPSFGWDNVPAGMTFTDNGNGTATLAGTPSSAGTYAMDLSAASAYGSAQQTLTVTVQQAPAITSGSSATFTTGTAGTFSVMTTGSPTAAITESGALPSGVTFVDNGNGTATLAGTAASDTAGSYPITITAANGVSPNATQSFTLTVNAATAAPVITSAGSTTFAVGTAGSFSVTTTGTPTAAITAASSPALPSGVTFKDNGNGTATLAGTPPAGSQGTYAVMITATNSAGTTVQSFTLTVNSGLAITSASSATATPGTAFSFTVTTTGTPTPTLTHTGTLPSGITFTANSNGTATLSGTPAATDKGPYVITFTARNSTGTASQAFTLTVDNTPTFTSAATLTETAGTAFTFTVSTTGYPTAALSAGSLPTGLSFSDNGNGTGTLSGTTAVAAGTDSVTVTATNAGGSTSQTITLTVKAAGTTTEAVPTFTSAATATATSGTAFTFTVTTAAATTYTTRVTHSGTLPAGISFSNNGNGTATLSGTPTAASAGVYPITFTATNSAGTTTQSFVLTVTGPPAISSAASATATVGSAFSFTVKATGGPVPTMAESGALPQGLTWTDNGNGTATLAGTPGVGQGGVYKLTLSATNASGTATQSFTLTVDQAPSITSASSATATHGTAFTFTFTSTGYPLPSVTHTGSVRGLTYTNNGNGTATLQGTPTTAGTYTLTITAKNSVGSATQTFTLTVS
jgi:Putative Ig domain